MIVTQVAVEMVEMRWLGVVDASQQVTRYHVGQEDAGARRDAVDALQQDRHEDRHSYIHTFTAPFNYVQR